MNDQTIDIATLRESLELNFKYFMDHTLKLFPNKTEEETAELFRRFFEPYPLMYMFAFISAACKKNGFTDVKDVVKSMTWVLQRILKKDEEESMELVFVALDQAVEAAKEYISENRTFRSIIFGYADQTGGKFVPEESHFDYMNIYSLMVLATYSEMH